MLAVTAPLVLADRYRLERQMASGGYGEVWKGTDLLLARPVAVKLLHPESAADPETAGRFRDEARRAGTLAHQGIARIYDYDDASFRHPPFLVMEFVDGQSLAGVLADGPVEPARVMDIVAQAAAALHAAHRAGLVHRHIKPDNILLSRDGLVKLADFGISQAAGPAPAAAAGVLAGTHAYLAPERVRGGRGTAASDLYALGVVAYQSLAGRLPFTGTAAELTRAHLTRPLPPLPPAVPAEVAVLISQLTAKDPAARPRSAGAVARRAAGLRARLIAGRTSQAGDRPPGRGRSPARRSGTGQPAARPSSTGQPPARAVPGSEVPLPEAPGPAGLSLIAFGPAGNRPGRPGRRVALIAAVLAVASVTAFLLMNMAGPARQHSAAAAAPSAAMVTVNRAALTGRPVGTVRRHLHRLGLVPRVRWRASHRLSPGRVLTLRPTGRVPSGSVVVVVAARRPAAASGGVSVPGASQAGSGGTAPYGGQPRPAGHGPSPGHLTPSATPSPAGSGPSPASSSPSPASSSPSLAGSPTPSGSPSPAGSPGPSGSPSPSGSPTSASNPTPTHSPSASHSPVPPDGTGGQGHA